MVSILSILIFQKKRLDAVFPLRQDGVSPGNPP